MELLVIPLTFSIFALGLAETASANSLELGRLRQTAYYLSPYAAPHAVAMHECQSVFGGRLLTILTSEQDERVTELLRDAGIAAPDRVWTSGKFQYGSFAWEWTTIARPFDYTNWGGSNPGIDGYCCAKIGDPDNRWRSNACTEEHHFVCEIVIN